MIRLENVSHRRNPGSGLKPQPWALRHLDVEVPNGGFCWLTGPAGSGKSTLVALLACRQAPTTGRLDVLGTDVARAGHRGRARLRRRIGAVDEHRRLAAHLTVLENVALPLRIDGAAAADARIDAIEMLEWLGAGSIVDRPAVLLSRGERLLCVIARAAVGRPELLVADEPFDGLPDAQADRFVQLLVEMNRLGTTVLLATASEASCRRHPARTLTIEHGRLRGRAIA